MKIDQPILLLNEDICKANINYMINKAREHHLSFRPHFKTHQSHEIGKWFYDYGVRAITVSSLEMAEYFAGRFDHISLAIPFNHLQINAVNKLSVHQKMALLVDHPDTIDFLERELSSEVGIWVEIDTGSKRSGLNPKDYKAIKALLEKIDGARMVYLEGLYSHAGHTYTARGKEMALNIFEDAKAQMIQLKNNIDIKDLVINMGDTPGCSLSDDFSGLNSISPGNFVFYDYTQTRIESCNEKQIAVSLACPVISKNQERMELVIYGGGIHLSKERLDEGGVMNYGPMVELNKGGWSDAVQNCYLRSISQEHGVLKVSEEIFDKYSIGDVVGILPIHSCMTADCMGSYLSLNGTKIDHMREKR